MEKAKLSLVGYIGAVLLIVGMICPIISYGYGREIIIYGYKDPALAFVIILSLIYMIGLFFNNKATVLVTYLGNIYFTFEIMWSRGKDILANTLDANIEVGYIILAVGLILSLVAVIIILMQKSDEISDQEKAKIVEKVVKEDGYPRIIGNHILGFRNVPLRSACFMIIRNNQLEFYSKDDKGNDFNIIIPKKSILSVDSTLGVAFENEAGKNEANLNRQVEFLKELIKRSPIMLTPSYIKEFEETKIDKSEHLQIYETNVVFINNERHEEKIKVESYESNDNFVEALRGIMIKKVNKENNDKINRKN